jgi:hypothetical protein
MSVAQDIQNQIDGVKAQLFNKELTSAEAVEFLNELKDVQAALGTADAEIAVRLITEAIQVLGSV